jgi:glutathione S-transferase
MKLYGSLASPYVARVTMFAGIKGVEMPLAEPIGGGIKSPEFLALSPMGRMPILDLGGQALAESEIICEYLNDLHPDKPGLPADPFERNRARLLSRIVDLYLAPNTGDLFRNMNPAERDQAAVDEAAESFAKACGYLEHFMGPGPLAVASDPTLADCSMAPYMGLMSKAVLPAFPDIPDPIKTDGKLGAWWHAVSVDPILKPMIEEHGVAVDGFVKMLRARQAG